MVRLILKIWGINMKWFSRYFKYRNGVAQSCNLGSKEWVMDYESMLNWYD